MASRCPVRSHHNRRLPELGMMPYGTVERPVFLGKLSCTYTPSMTTAGVTNSPPMETAREIPFSGQLTESDFRRIQALAMKVCG